MSTLFTNRRWILVFVATCISLGLSTAAAQNKKAQQQSTALPIKAAKARKPASETRVEIPGQVKAATNSMLSFRVSGLVEAIPVKSGDSVKKGDLIARLDTTHYDNLKSQAQANLKRAQAQAKDTKTEYERLRKLWAKKDVSQRRLENARAAMNSAKESVNAAQKQLDEAQKQLEYAHLKAPYDGLVARVPGSAHENVGAGQAIVKLVSRKLRFKAFIAPKIWTQKDDFTGYQCIFPALGDLEVKAQLHSIGSSALPPHRLVPVEVTLLKTGKLPVIPGMGGIMRITVKKQENDIACLLPASAVVATPKGKSQVWTVDQQSNTVQPKKVKTGQLLNGQIAITSGIQPGQWVVTAGQDVLSSGQKVKITHSPSSAK